MSEKYKCLFCGQHSALNYASYYYNKLNTAIEDEDGNIPQVVVERKICSNSKCNKSSYTMHVQVIHPFSDDIATILTLNYPHSSTPNIPSYVPKAIRDDFVEAYAIKDLSPKAAATLARRCLQGMIHDYWNINKGNLGKEIELLEEKVDPQTWEAIRGIRDIGNIGAHMEKDINMIIDVEPNEAQVLLEMIEQLIDDWYVGRENKRIRLKKLQSIVAEKK